VRLDVWLLRVTHRDPLVAVDNELLKESRGLRRANLPVVVIDPEKAIYRIT
jgi:hypothetical protein